MFIIKYLDPAVVIEKALDDKQLSDEEKAEMQSTWDNEPIQKFVDNYDVADWIFDYDEIEQEYLEWLKDEFHDEIKAECKERAESDADWEREKEDLSWWINH